MKIELLLNLENFQNIKFPSNGDGSRTDQYEEILPYVEDWIGYSQYALKLANHIRKILGLDPYEVENDGLRVVNEVEIKKDKKWTEGTKMIDTARTYNYKFADGKARTCNKCQGFLSFDDYHRETHPYGTHVDKDGHIIGDGGCSEWDGGV